MTNPLFSMVVNSPTQHFPSVPFSGLRLWDTQVTWADLQPSPGTPNFAALDAQLAVAEQNGKDVLYTFGKVPAWAGGGSVNANPPSDIATGNIAWKYFVASLVLHSLVSSTAKIAAYEVWNEPNLSQYWSGTQAQLIQMANDAVSIIKFMHQIFNVPVTIVGPACDGGGLVKQWLTDYYATGGPADVLNFHCYLDDYKPTPTSLPGLLADIAAKKKSGALPNKPVWFTEGSWGEMDKYATPLTYDQQSVYLAQLYILMWLFGIERFYWYAWDNTRGWGQLWSPVYETPAAIAYGVLAGWLDGALSTASVASNSNGTQAAPLALSSGVSAQIVWHPTQTHSLSTKAVSYQGLDGKSYPVKNGTVTVSPKPILLQFV